MMTCELLWAEDLLLEQEGVGRLHHMDLSIREGEALGVIGLSGSGKSALAEILCGERSPDSGTLRQAGQPVSREALAQMGLHIRQDSQLLSNLSVTDNLLVLGRPCGHKGGVHCPSRQLRNLCRELLEEFDLADCLDTPPGQLPLSVQHRLMLIGALVRQKRFVVLDHATDAYTPQEQALLSTCIHRLCSRRMTVICLTGHIHPLLWEMDRLTVIRNGRRVKELARSAFTETALRTYMCGYRAPVVNIVSRTTGKTTLHLDGLEIREGELVPIYDPSGTAQQFCARMQAQNLPHTGLLTSDSLSGSWIGSFSVLENLLLLTAPRAGGPLPCVPRAFRQMLAAECATATGLTAEQLEGPFSRLSRIERFRTLLFRELLRPTDLWLLDRVSAGADLQDRELIRQAVCRLPGILFYISGDYSELAAFGLRILTLDGDRLQEETL